jgi:TRAP transporter TAXI family solute receptor
MKEFFRIFGLGFLVLVAGFVLAFQFVKPSPPKTITIATGSTSGAYFSYAQRYKTLLAQEGIELKVVSTAGSIDNLERIESGAVDIAFVQSGTGQPYKSNQDLVALASLYYEPLWLFMPNQQALFNTNDLLGKRIAIGAQGSGTQALTKVVLDNNGVTENNTTFIDASSDVAAEALLKGNVDYLFLVASVESSLVQQLLLESSLTPFDFERAKAYTRRYRFLSATELPQGVVSFQRDIPATDVNLLSAAATVVAREDIHPALVALLMQVFDSVHGGGGILEEPGQFPSQHYVDFPVDASAKRYFEHGPPLLQRYLPFWAAVLVNQLKVFLIPLIALMIPLMRVLPILYRWRVRSRIYRWYRDLREIEHEANKAVMTDERREDLQIKLEGMRKDLMEESIPLSYHDELYHLRLHVELVRDNLQNKR